MHLKYYPILIVTFILLLLPVYAFSAEDAKLKQLYTHATRQPNRDNYQAVCDYMYTNGITSSIYHSCLLYMQQEAKRHPRQVSLQADVLLYGAMWQLMNEQEVAFVAQAKQAMQLYAKAHDSEREAGTCCVLGEYYNQTDLDEAHKYLTYGIQLTKGKTTTTAFELYTNEAANRFLYGDLDLAITLYLKSEKMGEQLKEYMTLSTIYSSLGIAYRRKQEPDKALGYYKKALHLAQREHLKAEESNVLTSIAVLYSNEDRHKEAVYYARKAVTAAASTECHDDMQKMQADHTLGSILMKCGRCKEAIPILHSSLKRAKAMQSSMIQLGDIAFLAQCFNQLGKRDSTEYYINQGKIIAKDVPKGSLYALTFTEIKARHDLAMHRYQEALEGLLYLKRVQNKQSQVTRDQLYRYIAQCYAVLGRPDRAFAYSDSAHSIRDSIEQLQLSKQMSEFTAKYKLQEKELTNARLHQHLAEQRVYVGVLVIALLVLALLLAVSLYRRKIQRMKMKEIQHKAEANANRNYIKGLEEERQRLAGEMHDGVCNDLVGVEMLLKMKKNVSADIIDMVKQSRENVRSVSHQLMPPKFTSSNLVILLTDMAMKADSTQPYRVSFASNTKQAKTSDEVSFSLYRIVQETFSNISSHAHPTYVKVEYQEVAPQQYTLTIENDGFVQGDSSGIGSQTMESRANSINAHLDSEIQDGVCVITMSGPYRNE